MFFVGIYFISFKIDDSSTFWGVGAALFIALLGLFSNQLDGVLRKPILDKEIRIIESPTNDGDSLSKYFNLNIKNVGNKKTSNLKVKIRDHSTKEWVNLFRPFFGAKDRIENALFINNLSPMEDDSFNLCRIHKVVKGFNLGFDEDIFITSNVTPHSQKFKLAAGESKEYELEIVSDNIKPIKFKVKIHNSGFDNSSVQIIH